MSLNRDFLIEIREREAHKEIKEFNANRLNELLYIRDNETNRKLINKSNRHEHNREALRGTKKD